MFWEAMLSVIVRWFGVFLAGVWLLATALLVQGV